MEDDLTEARVRSDVAINITELGKVTIKLSRVISQNTTRYSENLVKFGLINCKTKDFVIFSIFLNILHNAEFVSKNEFLYQQL